MKRNKTRITGSREAIGPLAAVSKRIEDFGFNLYFSKVFNDSVRAHQDLQDRYLEAFLDQDHEQMKKLDFEISSVESTFELTACMLDALPESPS
jgi:hypothetical protein